MKENKLPFWRLALYSSASAGLNILAISTWLLYFYAPPPDSARPTYLPTVTMDEIGMKVKAASPTMHTLFASVSDGCISYLHTEELHPEDDYEVEVTPLAYRYPGRLQAGCEKIALDVTSEMLKRLW